MAFVVLPQLKTKILEQYESNMATYPQKKGFRGQRYGYVYSPPCESGLFCLHFCRG